MTGHILPASFSYIDGGPHDLQLEPTGHNERVRDLAAQMLVGLDPRAGLMSIQEMHASRLLTRDYANHVTREALGLYMNYVIDETSNTMLQTHLSKIEAYVQAYRLGQAALVDESTTGA